MATLCQTVGLQQILVGEGHWPCEADSPLEHPGLSGYKQVIPVLCLVTRKGRVLRRQKLGLEQPHLCWGGGALAHLPLGCHLPWGVQQSRQSEGWGPWRILEGEDGLERNQGQYQGGLQGCFGEFELSSKLDEKALRV